MLYIIIILYTIFTYIYFYKTDFLYKLLNLLGLKNDMIILLLSNRFVIYFVITSIILFLIYYFNKSNFTINYSKYKKMNLETLKKMDWEDFEEMIKIIYEKKGYRVQRIGGHGSDGGIDLIIKKGLKTSMIQCKRYSGNVGVKIVREMYGLQMHHKFHEVYIYTSASFTKEAYKFINGKKMHLVDGTKILKEINKYL